MHSVRYKIFNLTNKRLTTIKKTRHLKAVLVNFVVPVTLGSLIYLLFRSKHLLVFHWLNAIGLYPAILAARQHINIYEQIPTWVIYSLPNGLWAYSFMYFISYIWRGTRASERILFVFMVLAVSLGSEIGQLLGVVPGTFCFEDFIVYICGLLMGFYFGNKRPKEATSIEKA